VHEQVHAQVHERLGWLPPLV